MVDITNSPRSMVPVVKSEALQKIAHEHGNEKLAIMAAQLTQFR